MPFLDEEFINFVSTTNSKHPYTVENGDDRQICIETNSSYRADEDYFKNQSWVKYKQESADHFFTYLIHYPEEKMISLKEIPETKI